MVENKIFLPAVLQFSAILQICEHIMIDTVNYLLVPSLKVVSNISIQNTELFLIFFAHFWCF